MTGGRGECGCGAQVRHWQNNRGEGKLFSFDLLDADGGEIRATAFNAACDKFNELVHQGRVYRVSKGMLKPARKQFNSLNSDYEISLEPTSIVEEVADDPTIASQLYNFRSIQDVSSTNVGEIVDVLGVLVAVSEITALTRRDGSEAHKRTITLADASGCSIDVTLWGKLSNEDGGQVRHTLRCTHTATTVTVLRPLFEL